MACMNLRASLLLVGLILIGSSGGYILHQDQQLQRQQQARGQLSGFPAAPPMQSMTSRYQEIITTTSSWPYAFKYYLYVPEHYDPTRTYPLVLLLHGSSRHMYGGAYYLTRGISQTHPAFVLVPIAPADMVWTEPVGQAPTAPAAATLALQAIQEVEQAYAVDTRRIYVSGYSLGGIGALGMVLQHPDVFAAALVLCGTWPVQDATHFPQVPLYITHGARDTTIPPPRELVAALQQAGKPVSYTEYPGVGHDVWNYVYTSPAMWDWLFAQARKD